MERATMEVAGQQIPVFNAEFEVISDSTRDHVQIRQGAATVLPNMAGNAGGLTIIPGHVYSTSDSEHKIWVRNADGMESQLSFWNRDVPVRPGHRLRLTWIGSRGDAPYCITNLTTGQKSLSMSAEDLAKKVGFNSLGSAPVTRSRRATAFFVLALLLFGGAFALGKWFGPEAQSQRGSECLKLARPVNSAVMPTNYYGGAPIYPKGTRMTDASVAALRACLAANIVSPDTKRIITMATAVGYIGGVLFLFAWIGSLFNRSFAQAERRKEGLEQFKASVSRALSRAGDLGHRGTRA